MTIGINVKRLRQDKGYTQGDLAKRSGIKLGHISKIERNETDPKVSTVLKLISALGCSANALLDDDQEMTIDSALVTVIERTSGLPQDDKLALIRVAEGVCIANGLDEIFRDGRRLALLTGKTDRMADKL